MTIPLDNPKNMTWSNTEAQTEYNRQLREDWKVEGNIGDRDYGQIFGRNFTLQEVQYVKGNDRTWAIFLYDHLAGNFTKLNVKTPKGSTSFSNPTFALLKSPDGSDSIVVTYFLHTGSAQPGEAGELIFYMEFKTIHFEVTHRDSLYSVDVTSNSTIPQQSFNLSGYERSISFKFPVQMVLKAIALSTLQLALLKIFGHTIVLFFLMAKNIHANTGMTQQRHIFLFYILTQNAT